MPINLGAFTELKEQAAVKAIIAERNRLREDVDRLQEELAHLRARSEQPPGGGPPPEIYLQWYGDNEGYHLIDDEAGVAGVTWCATRVWPRVVRYVRADDTAAAPDEEE